MPTNPRKSAEPDGAAVNAEVRAPALHAPRLHVHAGMPGGTTGHVLWWGGLAAVAALGVVEWPVALLVGTGAWVAEQFAKPERPPAVRTHDGEGPGPSA